jgi:CRISPR-associated protein Cas1
MLKPSFAGKNSKINTGSRKKPNYSGDTISGSIFHQREFSADKVSHILIYKGAAISSAAIALAVENRVDIVFFDNIGKPFARTYSCKFENAASVRRLQVKAYDDENIDISRQKLLGIEGEAARQYFSALKHVLPEEAYLGQRTRQPPQDLFNSLLGYGYGVLLTEIEKAAGGFLYQSRYP